MDKKKVFYNPEIWGGIECTINRVKDDFFDQLEYGNFYNAPPLTAITDLGIKKVRFPVLWEKHQPQRDTIIDWSWTENQLHQLKEKNVDVIAGLLHHGSGPAFTNMLDDHFPELLAAYAEQVAKKFPWINYYTPVNEPLTTARFSGLYGFWYPHQKEDSSFLIMLLNELKGTVLAMEAIRKINPHAQLVQTEDLGKTYSTPKLKYQADFENERRWLSFDILCGRVTKSHPLWKYFIKHGINEEKLQFFIEHPCTPDIFGFNHYLTSERYLDDNLSIYPQYTHGTNGKHKYADVEAVRVEVEEESGIEVLINEAWVRYEKPIAITEVHLHCHREEQLRWFKYVWDASVKLAAKGVEIKGVTAWALFGSFGWNRLLTEPGGEYEPGVYDIRSGTPRPTALRNFIKQLTTENACLHPLSHDKGWWQRDCRYIYVPAIEKLKVSLKRKNKNPILIIGKNGTLGKALAKICDHRSIAYKIIGRRECDITDLLSIEKAINIYNPWAVINATGYTDIDSAENEVDQCFEENFYGPLNLSSVCKKKGIKLVTFSADQVFDGEKLLPYIESDSTHPLNIYGHSKQQCEQELLEQYEKTLIIRSSCFFGTAGKYDLIQKLEKAATTLQNVTLPYDMFISPTYVPDLAHAVLDLLIDEESGIWHLANKGSISCADFAKEVAKKLQIDTNCINTVRMDEINYKAKRPAYSVLGTEKGYWLPTIENAMQRFCDEKTLHSIKVVS